jgi:hypothetical protein
MDLQSHLEAEKAVRKVAKSCLCAISEAWLDLDRYLKASEVHLSDARSHFSQLLWDSSTKPSLNPLPAYQPCCSHQSTSCAPVAAVQTFPPFLNPLALLVSLLRCIITMTIPGMPPLPNAFTQTVAADIPSRYVSATCPSHVMC